MMREFSAGGAVYKKLQLTNTKFQIAWLVTKSSPSKEFPIGFWRLPKGWLADEEEGKKPGPLARGDRKATENEIQKAALREVREEGGVRVKIVEKIGTERYFFTLKNEKILKFVTFYLMKWVKDVHKA